MDHPGPAAGARPDPYRVLDVPSDADHAAISRAYWRLAKQFHPDRNGSALGRRLMLVVNDAYETLKNPERRAAYDRAHRPAPGGGALATAPRPSAVSGSSQATSRTPAAPPVAEVELGPIQRRMAQQRATDHTWAGPRPQARALEFGRYAGRTIPEVVAIDPDYVEWFIRTPLGRSYAAEVDAAR